MNPKASSRLCLVAAILCLGAAICVSAGPEYHFLMNEMTQGEYIKTYWKESLAAVVLVLTGGFLLLSSEE